jgi:tetratricopeptide (TPR) repeat protein
MERHLSQSALVEVFSGQAEEPEVAAAVAHLPGCPPCWDRAARVIAELKSTGLLVHPPDARGAVVTLLEEEDREARSRLLARAAWASLKSLGPEEQFVQLKADETLRTQELFDTLLEEAVGLAPQDPFAAEETALSAYALAGTLSHSDALRNDLQSEAMAAAGNCRRLAADWRGSAAAFRVARSHPERGSGKPAREARLLSIEAALATDTGQLEQAQTCLARAAALNRKAGDLPFLATVAVQQASSLLAACRHEEAVIQAEESMQLLPPRLPRLEMLARNIITASLVFLGHPTAALRSYLATQPLCKQVPGMRTELQSEYLEALLLDSWGYAREAEKLFQSNIARRMEAELYKDAFLTLLTRFELLFQRGAFDKAAQVCEEALGLMRQPGVACHSQMEGLWRDLLALVQARRLTQHQVLAARHYLVRHWNVPAQRAPLEGISFLTQKPVGRATLSEEAPEPVDVPARMPGPAGVDYESAMEFCDRVLIEAGLAQCGGRIAETSRLLGITRPTLRARITKYGLAPASGPEGEDLLLRDEDREALGRLRARAWWMELRPLSQKERLARIEATRALQSRELFDTILEEASASALGDPGQGEETAVVAYTLAGLLPESRCPKPVKNDLQGAALGVVGNCRRLASDWQGSAAAFQDAQGHLARGSGDPAREARLLSFRASLAADMGHHDKALALLARAAVSYRSTLDDGGVAFTAVQEASTLLAANRHEEAVARAEQALRLLTPRDTRLEILGRNIVTASLVYLGRPAEALRSLHATRPLYEQFKTLGTGFQLTYLEGLVLDSLGYEREAVTVFHANITGRMEAGLFKDAFLTLLTRVELLFRRGALDKAARACAEAIELMEDAGEDRHAQTIALFRDLLALIDARRLTESGLLETRHALMRCWAAPAPAPAPEPAVERPQLTKPQGRRFLAPEPPPRPARLAPGDYEAVMERYEREVIEAGLAQGHGRIAETCRLLGISRNTLRERMRRYGFGGAGMLGSGTPEAGD